MIELIYQFLEQCPHTSSRVLAADGEDEQLDRLLDALTSAYGWHDECTDN